MSFVFFSFALTSYAPANPVTELIVNTDTPKKIAT